ncbi:putative membrane protein [Burkholderia cenocepacia]|uniref:Membrane protein n=1 Tax=Burkholderia cenocepacia TaxID=95486 RepID=A0AAN0RU27_9BURK|nr:putative membrane protein [Burkholderia cenocepacia]
MNNRNLLISITFDALLAACFYLFVVHRIEAAKHFAHVVLWFCVACQVIVVVSGRASECERPAPVNGAYDWVTLLVVVLVLVSMGDVVLPSALLISHMLFSAARGKRA